jgi:cytochrome c-type biogenesis protein
MGPYALAFVAGVISFTSPCCLPLMPGYVSYITGVASETSSGVAIRSRTLGAGVLFVVGFLIVFTTLGAAASTIGGLLLQHRESLIKLGGILVVVMGLATMGVLRIPLLNREVRFDLHAVRPGPAGALPLGMAFAIGWTPCIGPVLAGILTAAASVSDAGRGAALLFAYSLGLGLPFLLLAMGLGRGGRLTTWLRRRGRLIEIAGGALLVAMGVLMITGAWLRLFSPVLRVFSRTGWPPV